MEGKEIYILLMHALLCWRRPYAPLPVRPARPTRLTTEARPTHNNHGGRTDLPSRRRRRCTTITTTQMHDHDGRARADVHANADTHSLFLRICRLSTATDFLPYPGFRRSLLFCKGLLWRGRRSLYSCTPCFAGHAPSLHWRRPVASLTTPCSPY